MSDNRNGASRRKSTNWGLTALMSGAAAAWLIYDISSASEAPSWAVMILQYVLLVGCLIGLAGGLVKLMSGE